jgi:hypothetical protein
MLAVLPIYLALHGGWCFADHEHSATSPDLAAILIHQIILTNDHFDLNDGRHGPLHKGMR